MGKKKKTGFSQFDRIKDKDHDENIFKDHQMKIIRTEHGRLYDEEERLSNDYEEVFSDGDEYSIFFDDEENPDQPY